MVGVACADGFRNNFSDDEDGEGECSGEGSFPTITGDLRPLGTGPGRPHGVGDGIECEDGGQGAIDVFFEFCHFYTPWLAFFDGAADGGGGNCQKGCLEQGAEEGEDEGDEDVGDEESHEREAWGRVLFVNFVKEAGIFPSKSLIDLLPCNVLRVRLQGRLHILEKLRGVARRL